MPAPVNLSAREIFEQAVEQTPENWPEFVQTACAGNAALQAQVGRLLDAHLHAGSFMGRPVAGEATLSPQPNLVGETIGPYKLLEQLGEGGMGVVYVAEQREPVERRVALKIIKPGMDSRQVIARFEAERQTLALMDHPHIAKMFDAGTIEGNRHARYAVAESTRHAPQSVADGTRSVPVTLGRPYFVMELVTGRPITHYCDEHRLSTRQRLELFLQVCQAIQHAHQKGIIHRDIKPNNILVALCDGRPAIKVIDFGIAKATVPQFGENKQYTEFGAVVGTLEYMSPEQTELANPDIDTRSDIYSLGVLLYELLTGTAPLNRERLKQAVFTDVLQMIREEDPPTPSARLSELGRSRRSGGSSTNGISATGLPETEAPVRPASPSDSSLASISAQRQSDSAKLTKLVRGELDWIVMKALEKDRNRRYETANGFALDVQRYLADEPVLACPPSAVYRLRKFARRHMVALTTSALVAAALLIGTAISTWQAVEANRARNLANQRLRSETQALAEEREAKEFAEERHKQAEATAELLHSMFVDLNPRPRSAQPVDRELKDRLIARLDEAAARLEDGAADVLTQARLQSALGEAYLGLAEAAKAVAQLQRSLRKRESRLGPEHPDTLDNANTLAVAYLAAGKHELALPLAQQTLARRKAALHPDHPQVLTSMNTVAGACEAGGRRELALPLRKDVYETQLASLGPNHISTLNSMSNLGTAYLYAGDLKLHKLGLSLLEQTVEGSKRVLGAEHYQTLISMHNLASAYLDEGRLDLSLALCVEVFEKRKALFGPDHPDTLYSMHNLAVARSACGQHEAGLLLMEQTVQKRKARLGLAHPDTLDSMYNLASLYEGAGQDDRARQLYEQTLEQQKAGLGADHADTLGTMNTLAYIHQDAGAFDLALPLFEQIYAAKKASLGPDNPQTLVSMRKLADAYLEAGKHELGLPLFEQWLEQRRAQLGPDHREVRSSAKQLAAHYRDLGRLDKSEPLYRDLLVSAKKLSGPESRPTQFALLDLGDNLVRQQAFAEAEPLLRECLTSHEKQKSDYWTLFNTKSLLGAVLLGQKEYEAAEPLLLAGYEGLQQREETIPHHYRFQLTQALERLVELYDAWEQPEKAQQWREKLAAHRQAEKKLAAEQ